MGAAGAGVDLGGRCRPISRSRVNPHRSGGDPLGGRFVIGRSAFKTVAKPARASLSATNRLGAKMPDRISRPSSGLLRARIGSRRRESRCRSWRDCGARTVQAGPTAAGGNVTTRAGRADRASSSLLRQPGWIVPVRADAGFPTSTRYRPGVVSRSARRPGRDRFRPVCSDDPGHDLPAELHALACERRRRSERWKFQRRPSRSTRPDRSAVPEM
jgi:hypothetical protein